MAEVGVVIPAHNESRTIARALDALSELRDVAEIVVVCNGCSDNTASVVRAHAPWVALVELEQGSKPAALRAGDAAIESMPRLYLDADVAVTAAGIRQLVQVLLAGGYVAVAPTPTYDIVGAGLILRSYYRVWTSRESGITAVYGTGAILMSEEGRALFDEWPDVLSDDLFVDQQIANHRKTRVADVEVVVRLPTTLRGCVSRRARVHQGNRDLREAGLLAPSPSRSSRPALRQLIGADRRLVVHLPAYLGVTVAARTVSLWRRRRGTASSFHRDDSSRST